MFDFFKGRKVKDLSEEYINVVENMDDNTIGIEIKGYDEITKEYFLNKIIEVQKVKNPDKLVIGAWPNPANDTSGVLDLLIENKPLFSNLKSLYVGDMTYANCEISWIIQEDYADFLKEFDKLENLAIRGAEGLAFSTLDHKNLKSLEIVTGGLPKTVIHSIADGNLPNLEKLVLYIGVDNYGFDGEIEDIQYLMDNLYKFPKLKTLGIVNSEIQDEIVKVVINHEGIKNLEVLDLSYGTFTDMGAKVILENKDKIAHLKTLVLRDSYIGENCFDELSQLNVNVDLENYHNREVDWDEELEELDEDEYISDIYLDNDISPLYTE